MNIYEGLAKPLYVMAKPVGARCNLACEYCYYLEKSKLYDEKAQMMTEALLDRYVKEYIQSQTMNDVLFTWHGGEPLMRPLTFYKKAIELQTRYAEGKVITNALQTNGTLLTDEWCKFLHDNNFLVGISIDGPQEFHDEFRRTRGGGPSWAKVMKGIELLNKHDVEWNAMAVVNEFNADYPHDFYQFFKQIGAHYIQFAPIVERKITGAIKASHSGDEGAGGKDHLAHMRDTEGTLTDFSVSPAQWGKFLCSLFDEWVREDVGTYFIQLFDATLANWCGVQPGVCSMSDSCGHAAVMEWNGDVYSCDHFVFPDYKLGNLNRDTLVNMLYGEKQMQFSKIKQALPRRCRECKWQFTCHGECPKNRFVQTDEPGRPLNYLCDGYRTFFQHVAPYMDYMKQLLDKELPPANIMDAIRLGERF